MAEKERKSRQSLLEFSNRQIQANDSEPERGELMEVAGEQLTGAPQRDQLNLMLQSPSVSLPFA